MACLALTPLDREVANLMNHSKKVKAKAGYCVIIPLTNDSNQDLSQTMTTDSGQYDSKMFKTNLFQPHSQSVSCPGREGLESATQ